MIPSVLARQLTLGLKEYIRTTFPVSNPVFRHSIDAFLEGDQLFRGPFVAMKLPFQPGSDNNPWFEALPLSFAPYAHQQKAFDRLCGEQPRSTLVATGTGSGKTECFLYPILEYCYRHRAQPGIKAIVLYPMNALATDQAARIARLVYDSPLLRSNVSAGMYVGDREKVPSRCMSREHILTDRETIRNNPPDILLTNYKMLDYLLARPGDRALWTRNDPDTLRFVVCDEFHTYDGAQGTDLACLLRRLKSRLEVPAAHLCCVGTSATMGSEQDTGKMLRFATQVFAEPFDPDALVTEQRVSPSEYVSGLPVRFTGLPSPAQLDQLGELAQSGDSKGFLGLARFAWFKGEEQLPLEEELRAHSWFHELVRAVGSAFRPLAEVCDTLKLRNRVLDNFSEQQLGMLAESLLALVSLSRVLEVHVQPWFREMRRMVATVDEKAPLLLVSDDVPEETLKHCLPVVNCRDCGATGWVATVDERGATAIKELRTFYQDFFSGSSHVVFLFPVDEGYAEKPGEELSYLCKECSKLGEKKVCSSCGSTNTVRVRAHYPNLSKKDGHVNTTCPVCGSEGGMSLVGAQNATLISAGISELYASGFNDDKKLLAFSDSVQDASHRAGFFNARTWRFNLRLAMQRFAGFGGEGLSLPGFADGLVAFWKGQLQKEDFIATFIAPNMTWKGVYEHLVSKDRLPANTEKVQQLERDIGLRLKLEALYEYGFRCRVGRTLEKSGASIAWLPAGAWLDALPRLLERIANEAGELRNLDKHALERFGRGFFTHMKNGGGILDDQLLSFVEEGGDSYRLSNDFLKWMPGLARSRMVPRFLEHERWGKGHANLESLSQNSWTMRFARKVLGPLFRGEQALSGESVSLAVQLFIEEMVRVGALRSVQLKKGPGKACGLAPERMVVSRAVEQVQCNRCGHWLSVEASELEGWLGVPCFHAACDGVYERKPSGDSFFGRLYANGEVSRVVAAEHTGLVDRARREAIESSFKKPRDKRRAWDVNLLSCTPTLELGIDIGDLSSVLLCQVPPSRAQYLQRIGRPGRRDGNALSAVAVSMQPHDQYFFAQPSEMVAGSVTPPGIFLNAPAVLLRQFLAFCLDSWIKAGGQVAIPPNISRCMRHVEKPHSGVFPHNLLAFIASNRQRLLEEFVELFSDELDGETVDKLRSAELATPMLDAFRNIKHERDSIARDVRDLVKLIAQEEGKPHDSSNEKHLQELHSEKQAMDRVVKTIDTKNVFNFLSDEGLLPNYAFPEAGISLKAIIYRNAKDQSEEEPAPGGWKPLLKQVYEYTRPAASAIHEFAPDNTFYSTGRKMRIDQVDLKVSKAEAWRLCPDCSHAQLSSEVTSPASCPHCGSRAWADAGQVRNLLRMRQVYATEEDVKSRSGDESDDRQQANFLRTLYVDMDVRNDVEAAYRVEDDDQPFGFEFVRKATLREINFGGLSPTGEPLLVAGEEKVRTGFSVCRFCGKVQHEPETRKGKFRHYYSCQAHNEKDPSKFLQTVYLFREFSSEILRILVPSTSNAADEAVLQSFSAAVMLGLKEYFGSVDHLKATFTHDPVPGGEYRRNALVIFDSVPGGTGYLKHLSRDPDTMFELLQKALDVMVSCPCASDPNKDGCYRCLYAYRLGHKLRSISRSLAVKILNGVMKHRGKLVSIGTIDDIELDLLFDSELERKFLQALEQASLPGIGVKLQPAFREGRKGFALKVNEHRYFVGQQVELGRLQGVEVPSRADFLVSPWEEGLQNALKPIAVFTDGFSFHRDRVGEDIAQRMAIVRGGHILAWSISWLDVEHVFHARDGYFSDLLDPSTFPDPVNFQKMRNRMVETFGGFTLHPKGRTSLELLLELLARPELQKEFQRLGFVYAMGQSTLQGKVFSGEHLSGLGMVKQAFLLAKQDVANYRAQVRFTLDDSDAARSEPLFQKEWNGFLRAFNFYQFQPGARFVTQTGERDGLYTFLEPASPPLEKPSRSDGWEQAFADMLDDTKTIAYARQLRSRGMAPPDVVGFELLGPNGAVIGEAELAWQTQKTILLRPDQQSFAQHFAQNGWQVLHPE
ncbi:MAG TPA: DEAD/DEAH box helicase [Thermotogota bacterium]|nr:DEAD/DEAH box helicase [Thermotogota bacterium]